MPNFLTVNQTAEKYPFIPVGGLRYAIFHAEKNGLAKAIRRIGRKVLLEETSFLEWVDSNGGQK